LDLFHLFILLLFLLFLLLLFLLLLFKSNDQFFYNLYLLASLHLIIS